MSDLVSGGLTRVISPGLVDEVLADYCLYGFGMWQQAISTGADVS